MQILELLKLCIHHHLEFDGLVIPRLLYLVIPLIKHVHEQFFLNCLMIYLYHFVFQDVNAEQSRKELRSCTALCLSLK